MEENERECYSRVCHSVTNFLLDIHYQEKERRSGTEVVFMSIIDTVNVSPFPFTKHTILYQYCKIGCGAEKGGERQS